MDDLSFHHHSFLEKLKNTSTLKDLESLRLDALGKKGFLTEALKELQSLTGEAKKERAILLNSFKEETIKAFNDRLEVLEAEELNAQLVRETIDVTLPGRPAFLGTLHPVSQTIAEIVTFFKYLGFVVATGPDIENDYNNFTALNIPEEHPARQDMDTFYLPQGDSDYRQLLRTHTSPVQVRFMKEQRPPIRIVVPGRVYRSDYDATHSPMFHQVEGLMVGEDIHMGHLKGVLNSFCRWFFQKENLPVRFRASFFPFTEPSAEIDIGCKRTKEQLLLGEGDDWLEILGCGMVHPKVLENCGIDSKKYRGFAFGMGVERLACLKYGIPDLRALYEADLRWLRHYGFQLFNYPSL